MSQKGETLFWQGNDTGKASLRWHICYYDFTKKLTKNVGIRTVNHHFGEVTDNEARASGIQSN